MLLSEHCALFDVKSLHKLAQGDDYDEKYMQISIPPYADYSGSNAVAQVYMFAGKL